MALDLSKYTLAQLMTPTNTNSSTIAQPKPTSNKPISPLGLGSNSKIPSSTFSSAGATALGSNLASQKGNMLGIGSNTASEADVRNLQVYGTPIPKPVSSIPADVVTQQTPSKPPSFTPTTTPTYKTTASIDSTIAQGQSGSSSSTTTSTGSSTKGRLDKYLESKLSSPTDIAAQKEQIREEARLAEKEKASRDLSNQILARKTSYERQIEELEKNREGTFGGALAQKVNKLSQEGNRELADLAIQYQVVNGDYQAAEKIVGERLQDIKDQNAQEAQWFQIASNYINDDLTESEKLQIQQAFEEKQSEKNFAQQKELALYKSYLDSATTNANGLNTLSAEDNARLNATPQAKAIQDATKYASALKDYKQAIADYGTGQVFGKGSGALGQTYSALIGATKDYYTLGSYDNGVQKLIELGIKEPSVFGLKSSRVGALDTALAGANTAIQRNAEQLKNSTYGNSVEVQSLLESAGISSEAPDPLEFGVNANPLNLDL